MGFIGFDKSINTASVRFVSIAALNVNLTVVAVATPLAPSTGIVAMMVGCACAPIRTASDPAKASHAAKRLLKNEGLDIMAGIQLPLPVFVTPKDCGRWLAGAF